jgi:hypothetical protein
MSSIVIHDGMIAGGVTALSAMERAIEIGKMPYAEVRPAIYLCGECRVARIDKDAGICGVCRQMFDNRELSVPVLSSIAFGILVGLVLTVGFLVMWAIAAKAH